MSLAALEFNDQSLLIQAEEGPMHAEPGFARITAEGIVTGEDAHALAWREPQHSYNQFWCHLNQTPLAAKQKWARHHGDVAFSQLGKLWRSAGSPESLMVLVPGSFTDDQLSLLLGMAQALPAKTLAIIDSALAACLEVEQATLYADLQLHQTVLTVCRPSGSSISVDDQEVIPALGIMQIQNSVARHISHMLIDSFRYDPLHASDTEQAIYDQVPGWLTRLNWEDEVSATLETDKGELPFILTKRNVMSLISERLDSVRSFIARHPGCKPLLSHASGLLAGLTDEFEQADVAGQSASTDLCLAQHPVLLDQIDGLFRVRKLDRDGMGVQAPPPEGSIATHVLYGDQALPLRRPVSIRIDDEGVHLVNEIDDAAALTVVLRNRSLETMHAADSLTAALPQACLPGEFIVVGDHQFRLIEVRDG